jgi:hypothetical protein
MVAVLTTMHYDVLINIPDFEICDDVVLEYRFLESGRSMAFARVPLLRCYAWTLM